MSTATITAPTAEDVIGMMNDLFGLDVTPTDVPEAPIHSIAEYLNEASEVVGFIACDLETSCRLGSALTQIPAGRVDEAIKDGAMPESISENLAEVFNISLNLLTAADGGRVLLGRTAFGESSEHFAELNAAVQARTLTSFGFEVTRYGKCLLSVGL